MGGSLLSLSVGHNTTLSSISSRNSSAKEIQRQVHATHVTYSRGKSVILPVCLVYFIVHIIDMSQDWVPHHLASSLFVLVGSKTNIWSFLGLGLGLFTINLYATCSLHEFTQCSGVLLTPCSAVTTPEGAVSTRRCCTNTSSTSKIDTPVLP